VSQDGVIKQSSALPHVLPLSEITTSKKKTSCPYDRLSASPTPATAQMASVAADFGVLAAAAAEFAVA
jgi:hypothetical protein